MYFSFEKTEQSRENEHEWLLSDCRVDRREREQEQRRFKLNALAARTATVCELWCESADDRVTRQATSDPSDRQTAG